MSPTSSSVEIALGVISIRETRRQDKMDGSAFKTFNKGDVVGLMVPKKIPQGRSNCVYCEQPVDAGILHQRWQN